MLAQQLLAGLAHLKKNGLKHVDTNPNNIMVDNSGHLKIIDFGLAMDINKPTRGQGTLDYIAPEGTCNNRYHPVREHTKSDSYAAGNTLLELLGNFRIKQSYTGFTQEGELENVIQNQHPARDDAHFQTKLLDDHYGPNQNEQGAIINQARDLAIKNIMHPDNPENRVALPNIINRSGQFFRTNISLPTNQNIAMRPRATFEEKATDITNKLQDIIQSLMHLDEKNRSTIHSAKLAIDALANQHLANDAIKNNVRALISRIFRYETDFKIYEPGHEIYEDNKIHLRNPLRFADNPIMGLIDNNERKEILKEHFKNNPLVPAYDIVGKRNIAPENRPIPLHLPKQNIDPENQPQPLDYQQENRSMPLDVQLTNIASKNQSKSLEFQPKNQSVPLGFQRIR